MGLRRRCSAWLHRSCAATHAALLRDRDRLETDVLTLTRRHDALTTAYQGLFQDLHTRFQVDTLSRTLNELFTERDDAPASTYLTPSFEEREGTSGG